MEITAREKIFAEGYKSFTFEEMLRIYSSNSVYEN